MNEFTRGVVWTVGMYMFGKGMYDLGKLNEARKDAKAWKELNKKLEEMSRDLEEKIKEVEEAE